MSELYGRAFGSARFSPHRLEIARAVLGLTGAFTVDDLVTAVRRANPQASTATIYRSVTAMEEAGFIERVGERDGAALYAHCESRAHHHHVVCDECGKTAHAECPLGSVDVASLPADGFVVTRHEVTLYGLCPQCAASAGACG